GSAGRGKGGGGGRGGGQWGGGAGECQGIDAARRAIQLCELFASRHVPQANRVIVARRGQRAAVGRQRNYRNVLLAIAAEFEPHLAGGDFPKADRVRVAGGKQRPAVGREGQGSNVLRRPDEPPH